ncbi:Hemerythrin HHE cation binding domain-containing protein [Nitrosotalea devaniterrae]|uniref:Hemerythrin HHE cation binding domain-containing protein n=1 Tax=Nitrosotalea devaniterrae TaxID=1078905 RepID=A0A128A1R1_9ARCH|nr:Hemerythrin HHE cation binding domain-containing protein [Candidatus Nitrosotalea devanaterra]
MIKIKLKLESQIFEIIMSTASLKRDHALIEKVLKSMWSTIPLLKSGKTIPEPILNQVIDFSMNFTDVCHHGKEENSLFPELEKKGMPRNSGPIAVMLMEHEVTRKIATRMETSSKTYLKNGDATQLIVDMQEYINHVVQHLWKENNRLFEMAEMALRNDVEQVNKSLQDVEDTKLKELGKTREDYERFADEFTKQYPPQD